MASSRITASDPWPHRSFLSLPVPPVKLWKEPEATLYIKALYFNKTIDVGRCRVPSEWEQVASYIEQLRSSVTFSDMLCIMLTLRMPPGTLGGNATCMRVDAMSAILNCFAGQALEDWF